MNFLSICSGIEAASVAWSSLGWKAIAFAEIEKFPSAVLAHHYPDVPNLGDMTKLPERIRNGEIEAPDILCGGTPCQAFSVAGLRRSLDDARGNLSLIFCEIADELDAIRTDNGDEPIVVFWENVPGVLNTKDNAFGCFLAGLAGEDEPPQPSGGKWTNAGLVLGPQRAVAWRVLDAQYFGVAQRRRRVFVVASARDGFDPAAVLFEFDGVRRDSAPSREAREGVTGTIGARDSSGGGFGTDFECAGCVQPVITMAHGQGGAEIASDRRATITCNHEAPIAVYPVQCVTGDVTHTLKAEGFDASEDGTGRGQPIVTCQETAFTLRIPSNGAAWRGDGADNIIAVHGTQDPCSDEHVAFALGRNSGQENAIAFNPNQEGIGLGDVSTPIGASTGGGNQGCVCFAENSRAEIRLEGGDGQRTGTLSTGGGKPWQGAPVVAVFLRGREGGATAELGDEIGNYLRASGGGGDKAHVLSAMQVRRLTPRECERLQGFPDDYTLIPYGRPSKSKLDADFLKYQLRGNPKHLSREDVERLASDGPRYKALGNSWAVPNVRWIGKRIDQEIKRSQK